MFDPEVQRDAAERFKRFEKLFRLQANIYKLADSMLDGKTAQLRGGAERNLSLLVGASLGMAMKTFYAIHQLCLMGWGEDALVLLRSNVNLLINLGYILRDEEPAERAADFIAYSFRERVKYMESAHGDQAPTVTPPMPAKELEERANRWRALKIRQRAARVDPLHYTVGYALQSSFEHCDAMALQGYIVDWDEVGPRIHASGRDEYIEAALGHSAKVFADVVTLFALHFGLGVEDIRARIGQLGLEVIQG